MSKKSFSKHVIALMITFVLMLSCIGTAAAASLQVPQEDVTETETVLEDSQDENTSEVSHISAATLEDFETEQVLTEESIAATEVQETENEETAKAPEAEGEAAAETAEAEIPEIEETAVEADTARAETIAADLQTDNDDSITGAVLEDDVYVYYENGEKAAKTGLAKAVDGTGWYYMANGTHDSSAEGICKRIDGVGGWFYVRDGKYRTDLTGIAKKVDRTGGWYYVRNGVYKTDVTGISKKIDGTGGWYYVKNGVYNTNVTGIAKKADGTGGWYYVRKGVYKTDATGICKKADGTGGWYYVKNGVYNTNATGITRKVDGTDTRLYYVQKGVYKSTASGIAKKTNGEPGWFYVRNGVYRSGASGIAKKADGSSDTWFYVENGSYNTSFIGLARKADCSSATQFYVKNGIFTKSNISSYDYLGGTYRIANGVASLKSGYNNLWVQDVGVSYVDHDGDIDVFYSMRIKNTDGKYPFGGTLEVTCYSSSYSVLSTDTQDIPKIVPGDTIYCTLHFKYQGQKPAYIGMGMEWIPLNVTNIAKASTFSLLNTSQKKYDSYSKYTGTIKSNHNIDVWVCVSIIYYKDGQMVGGHHEQFGVKKNNTRAFSMTVYNEPDYDSYKLFVSQMHY